MTATIHRRPFPMESVVREAYRLRAEAEGVTLVSLQTAGLLWFIKDRTRLAKAGQRVRYFRAEIRSPIWTAVLTEALNVQLMKVAAEDEVPVRTLLHTALLLYYESGDSGMAPG